MQLTLRSIAIINNINQQEQGYGNDLFSKKETLPLQGRNEYIEEALREGESVTIRGLGSFNLAITSEGFEHPDDVMPGKVRVSRIYFKPDRSLVGRLRQNMDFFRYPLSKYFPHEMLRPETLERERVHTPNTPEDEAKDISA